jgi:glucose 1-dehydrogenase
LAGSSILARAGSWPVSTSSGSSAGLATDVVLKNIAMFGSVNANRRHCYRAARVLAAADQSSLEKLVTRRVRPGEAPLAVQRAPDDIKVVMEFAQA